MSFYGEIINSGRVGVRSDGYNFWGGSFIVYFYKGVLEF